MRNTKLLSATFAVGLLLAAASPAFAVDNDGDGWDSPADCNDFDTQTHPGAFEVVGDGVDQDCDAQEDCYADSDNDGARTTATTSSIDLDCDDNFEGRVADPIDCDDADPGSFPGGTEVCDGGDVDEDCDGAADDSDPEGAVGETTWHADSDGDGYGDSTDGGTLACDAPTGTVADDADCDDTDAGISPGDAEVCDADTKDDDCDGTVDCDDTDCSAAPSCTGTVEVFDHLECFKIKTTEKLKAYLDVDPGPNPPFELAAGCTIGKATKYCVPVMKTVAVVDAKSTLTPDPNYEGQELTDDRICYKVKCPDTAVTTITLTLKDRFGNRQFTKFKSSEICTPAEQVP